MSPSYIENINDTLSQTFRFNSSFSILEYILATLQNAMGVGNVEQSNNKKIEVKTINIVH